MSVTILVGLAVLPTHIHAWGWVSRDPTTGSLYQVCEGCHATKIEEGPDR